MRRSFYLASASTNNLTEAMKLCSSTVQGVRHPNHLTNLYPNYKKEEKGYCPGILRTLHPSEYNSTKHVQTSQPPGENEVIVFDHQKQVHAKEDTQEEKYDEINFREEQDLLKMTELFHTEVDACFTCTREDSTYLQIVKKLRNIFLDALFEDAKRYCVGDSPGEIPETLDQRKSEIWRAERSIRFPASMAKYFIKLPQVCYADALREHLWTLLPGIASMYGIEMEDKARVDYIKWAQAQDETTTVQQTGMWVNPAFPQLSCSPDGIVRSQKSPPKLLEIKCPEFIKNANFADFESCIRSLGLDYTNFCLQKNSDGTLSLKRNSSFWFQMQVSMGILNFEESHLMLWSPNGFLICTVKFDSDWWELSKKRLIQLHAELWVPEYFLMRIPRYLRPLRIPFEME
ncbi:hypothetical protein FOCC_FOCC016099 [Frankliniella occidentalis]|uniref:Uncharacterized protein LOC113217866 n=1 Tax=Frankliniella occidentalis TaxID=133901 RepID=A0A6J1TST5_FRAOC|nr:uncharacterized protein LOC113217866 [Frankliniella occidentalis]KAE8738409.1 hypothetical protein FOCC_FOCC016099 [Frankliniella occidentalis]